MLPPLLHPPPLPFLPLGEDMEMVAKFRRSSPGAPLQYGALVSDRAPVLMPHSFHLSLVQAHHPRSMISRRQ